MAIRVFVVDDSDVFRDAIRDVVNACADFDLAGVAHSGEEALTELSTTTADLILIDVTLPGMDGLETSRHLIARNPSQFVMLCSVGTDPRLTSPDRGLANVVFVSKARISPRSLREAWSAHVVSATS